MSGRSSFLLFPPSDEKTEHCRLINSSLAIVKGEPCEFLAWHCLNGKWAEEAVDGIRPTSKWHFFNESLSDTHSVTQIQAFQRPRSPASCIQQKLWGSIIYCLSICGTKEPCLSPGRALCLHSPYPTLCFTPIFLSELHPCFSAYGA